MHIFAKELWKVIGQATIIYQKMPEVVYRELVLYMGKFFLFESTRMLILCIV